ncbi:MAG: MATE family efflux transporter, partial [Spirochaetes bacterium]|nr:MATE family efflux transporter [Spirochaetota bacterium]
MLANIWKKFVHLWKREGGYYQLLKLAVPLILSTGTWSILHFIDRMFLTWYSPEAIAAAMPAGILNFTLISIFMGTGNYVATFVAQYFGAKQYEQIGAAIWQGVFLSIIGGFIIMCFSPFSDFIFRIIGHSPELQVLESDYFKIVCLGAIAPITSSTLGGFYMGRGKNWPVMWINFFIMAVNLVLDYLLIFGKYGFPEMGIKGAALATIIAGFAGVFIYLVLIFQKKYADKYGVKKGLSLDFPLMKRILKFG